MWFLREKVEFYTIKIDSSKKLEWVYSAIDFEKVSLEEFKTQLPILFIHGTDDKFVPVRMTYENYKACNAPKELLIVLGAIHGQSYDVEQEKYEAATRTFWGKYQ